MIILDILFRKKIFSFRVFRRYKPFKLYLIMIKPGFQKLYPPHFRLSKKAAFFMSEKNKKNCTSSMSSLKRMLILDLQKRLCRTTQKSQKSKFFSKLFEDLLNPYQSQSFFPQHDDSKYISPFNLTQQQKKKYDETQKLKRNVSAIILILVLIGATSIVLQIRSLFRRKSEIEKIQAFLTYIQSLEKNSYTLEVTCGFLNQAIFISKKGRPQPLKDLIIPRKFLVPFLEKTEEWQKKIGKQIKLQFNHQFLNEGRAFLFEVNYFFYFLFITYTILGYKLFKKIPTSFSADWKKLLGVRSFEPIKPETIQIFFNDVAGMHEAKFQITQFVDFLSMPEKYIEMGAKIPKGALLSGPPGTGKTLLAKACAGQAGVPFFYVSGSEFVDKYVGQGAARVRRLFDQAEKKSPSIIFIDEIDAIGRKRGAGPFINEQKQTTLNQLLVRMDGFQTTNKVIVMAATNRKDILDPALLRPGRFDRAIQVSLPNLEQRQQILKVHLQKVTFNPQLTIEELSKKVAVITPGFSGAELANICNEAAILAARQHQDYISLNLFQKATERVMAGLEKRNLLTQQEKDILAVYESGKTVTSWFTKGSDPVIKVSILPFSKSGTGYSHSIQDETALNTKDELLDKACCYLSGRAAEEYFRGYVTTHGDRDLQRAKRIITLIVTKFGMSDSLKMMAFPDIQFTKKPYSEKVQKKIDTEIRDLMKICQKRVKQLIEKHEDKINLLKEKLLEKQTLSHHSLKQILGDRPAGENKNYQLFLKDQEQQFNKQIQKPTPSDAGVQPFQPK